MRRPTPTKRRHGENLWGPQRWRPWVGGLVLLLVAPQVGLSASLDRRADRGEPPEAVVRFQRWLGRWSSGGPVRSLEEEGRQLAEERRTAYRQWIREDPQRAVEAALPESARAQLPAAIRDRLESTVTGRGFFGVLCTFGDDSHSHGPAQLTRHVVLDGRKYEAYVYGRRVDMATRALVPIRGVVVDDVMAVAEDAVRRLSVEEVAMGGGQGGVPRLCHVCGQPLEADGSGIVGEWVGDRLWLCSEEHWVTLNQTRSDLGSAGGAVAELSTVDSSWTEGLKQVVLIRIDFDDLVGEPVTESAALELLNHRASAFFEENSYGKTAFEATVTPVYRMPEPASYYRDNDADVELLSDARAAARAGGFDPSGYDLDIVGFKTVFSGWAGRGYVGGKGLWLNGYFDDRVTFHELGHNYGLWHANAWDATGDTVIGEGTAEEYGDTFDTMGRNGGASLHFGAWYKSLLGWLGSGEYTTVAGSGTFRVFAQDTSDGIGLNRYLRIPNPRGADYDYGVEFRQKVTSNRWLMSGVKLTWLLASNGSTGSRLLDTTPGTAEDRNDHPIVVGRTFSDVAAGIHITPVGKGGTVPESMDIVVNLGAFPENHAPAVDVTVSALQAALGETLTFTASGLDQDGDALAYAWDFGDKTFGDNLAQVTKSWPSTGQYVVRCEVSDMKGGTSSEAVLVTVGVPNASIIRGEVRDAYGEPVEGLRVSNGLGVRDSRYRVTWSDSSGGYTLANLVAGSYTLAGVAPGYAVSATGWANPLTVGPNLGGVDFLAVVDAASLSGRVTAAGQGVSGVVVSDGKHAATTDANGDYLLTDVPQGNYVLAAAKAGYSFVASGFSNPVVVESDDLGGLDFIHYVPTYTLNGEIVGVQDSSTLRVTDGVRESTCRKVGKRATFALAGVPAGTWHLRVVSESASYAPDNFTNPLRVTGDRSGLAFAREAVRTHGVSGRVSEAGLGLAGVEVAVGTTVVLTDSGGGYYAGGLPEGSFMVVPERAGLSFQPQSQSVSLTGMDVSGVDFTAVMERVRVDVMSNPTAWGEETGDGWEVILKREGGAIGELVVGLAWSGTADPGVDYLPMADSVRFLDGEETVVLQLQAVPDTRVEGAESVSVRVVPGDRYGVGESSQASGMLEDSLVDQWRLERFGGEAQDPAVAGDAVDADGDGWSNLAEFVFGMDPRVSDASAGPRWGEEAGERILEFRQRKALGQVVMSAAVAADLSGTWDLLLDAEATAQDEVFLEVRWVDPSGARPARFLRVQVRR